MIFLSSLLFFPLTWLLVVYHWVKYGLLLLFTPITKWEIQRRLNQAGIKINGKNPWDIQVNRPDFYARAGTYYALGYGEAYMDGSIHVEDVVELTYKIMRNKYWRNVAGINLMQYFNMQTKSRAWQVGRKHYDIGNELFEAMLDPAMNYTCGYWRNASNLADAQVAKMDLIAKKLNLKPGMRVLDIGCGFGGLAKYLAENYGVQVVGCTISVEQAKFAKERFAHSDVDIQLIDYRDVDTKQKFDRIVSIEMFEHVGEANYTTYFKKVRSLLSDDGIFILQTSGVCDKEFPLYEPFSHKYIFVNGIMPRQRHITKYIDGLFYIEDWHNFGHDYTKTLAAWAQNFKKGWPSIESKYNDTFYRMWIFYLQTAQGIFLARKLNVWQIVLTKQGLDGGYVSQR